MQTSYSRNMPVGIAGGLYDLSDHTVDAYAVETDNIYPGMGVVRGTDPVNQVKLPAAISATMLGIALLQDKEQDASGNVIYADTETVPVLVKGRAWVPVIGAVTAGQPAYVVYTGDNKGKFGAASNYTGATPAAAGAAAAYSSNTGNGTITTAPATGSGCKVGTYKVTCIEPATNSGKFLVQDPDGITIGVATVAAEFSTHLTFTIADGATDFASGDGFNIVVAASTSGTAAPVSNAKFITSTSGAGLAVVELS